ncbi:hypothetical protein HCB14_05895 [Listeria marthii]|nr:hypothetical protein [Listeria marthii]
MFKRLRCEHIFDLIKAGPWRLTFETSNGLDDADERVLVVRCFACGKRKNITQTKRNDQIIDYVDILAD